MTLSWINLRSASGVVFGIVAAYAVLHGYTKLAVIGTIGVVFLFVALRFPLYGLLAWIFFAPAVSGKFKVSLPAGLPDLTFSRLTIASIVLALGLQAMIGARRLSKPGAVEACMIFLVFVCVVDILVRGDRIGSIGLIYFDEYITPFLFFYAAKHLVTTERDLNRLCAALTGLGIYLAMHGVYQYLTHSATVEAELVGSAVNHHLSEGRARGLLGNSVEYGGVLAIAFIWALYSWVHARSRVARTLLAGSLVTMCFGILFSLTRAVWLGVFFAILAIGALRRRLRTVIVVFVMLIAAGLLAAWLFSPSPWDRIQERVESVEPVYIRIVMYSAAASMIADRPIVGYGRGEEAFIQARAEHLSSVGTIDAEWGNLAGPPHNIYLYVAIQWGLLGIVPYLLILLLVYRSSRLLNDEFEDPEAPARWLASLFIATWLLYVVVGMFDDISAFTTFTNLFFITAGAVDGVRSRVVEARELETLAGT